jgi:hypothetical protein
MQGQAGRLRRRADATGAATDPDGYAVSAAPAASVLRTIDDQLTRSFG